MTKEKKRWREDRIEASLPVFVNAKTGLTKDINSTGLFFEINEEHTPGSKINLEVEINTNQGLITLICQGEVVRVEKKDGKLGVGAKILIQEIKGIKD
ncbi:MAG: hypothetical protein RIT35_1683 [Pseudomonadota bacterium]|jgi:hypothetical protein